MYKFTPDKDINCKCVRVKRSDGKSMPILILLPKDKKIGAPGVLWIHGGGYRLSFMKPYPAAINDCYDALIYLKDNADALGINRNQIMVGGESAGGGLCAALCMMARDKGEVNIAYQMPLYPMIDNFDTDSSKDNHGKVWNTRRNHMAWRMYLRKDAKNDVSPYAAPSRQKDCSNLPPAYTFVGDGEPFYSETVEYIDKLNEAGIYAKIDIYQTNMHAFDMMKPKLPISEKARMKFNNQFEYACEHFFAENK